MSEPKEMVNPAGERWLVSDPTVSECGRFEVEEGYWRDAPKSPVIQRQAVRPTLWRGFNVLHKNMKIGPDSVGYGFVTDEEDRIIAVLPINEKRNDAVQIEKDTQRIAAVPELLDIVDEFLADQLPLNELYRNVALCERAQALMKRLGRE